MVKQTMLIHNPSGVHARPAALFAKTAKQYQSSIKIHINGKAVNGKSMVALLSAGITCGTKIELEADGVDEENALIKLVDFVESGCGEE